MSNSFTPSYPLESIGALCHNLFAFEYALENLEKKEDQKDYQLGYSTVYFRAGSFHIHNEQQEIMSYPFDLSITQNYVLLVHSETEEVITHFQLTQDVLMVIDHKQAFILRLEEKLASASFNRIDLYEKLREIVPSEQLLSIDSNRMEVIK